MALVIRRRIFEFRDIPATTGDIQAARLLCGSQHECWVGPYLSNLGHDLIVAQGGVALQAARFLLSADRLRGRVHHRDEQV